MSNQTGGTWEVVVSLQRMIEFPIEDNEDKEKLKTWLQSKRGKDYILKKFLQQPRVSGSGRNTDIAIDDIEIKEER